MDFFEVFTGEPRKKGGPVEVYADFEIKRSKDLMVQGGAFYAVWNVEENLWSRDEYHVVDIVDKAVREAAEEMESKGISCSPKYLRTSGTKRWYEFRKFLKNISDNSHPLDTKVVFKSTKTDKSDYASRRLNYDIGPGSIEAYDELVSRLYSPENRAKFEWAIGAVLSGDAKKIEKFLVFYGSGGTGKSTVMDIISKIFGGKVKEGGYVAFFDAQALTGNSNAFATEAFKDNPLVAIQHDGDLSKIENNARLNSIVSHEEMSINEKYKATYDNKINAMLFMGTNKPVQITDAKSGLIRRLIDVNPTEETFAPDHYYRLRDQINFELGAIAHHCLQVYRKMGKNAYSKYEPTSMMLKTDPFRNFVDDHYDIFKRHNGTTLNQAWELYKIFIQEGEHPFKLQKIRFREELKNYFSEFHDRLMVEGAQLRSVYRGFKTSRFRTPVVNEEDGEIVSYSLAMEETESLLDEMYAGLPAQYGNSAGNPKKYWDDSERIDKKGNTFIPRPDQICSTTLGDIDTGKLHFLKVPEHHIVIDLDLTDDDGNKSLERNLEAAATMFPQTYAELSKSGNGVHLHYIYDGDVSELAREYSEHIEIKVYTGNASLRRKLTKCNNVAVKTINSGLPFREKKPMLTTNKMRTENGIRDMIHRNLRKEFHNSTKSSVDFIEHILQQAYRDDIVYDVSDLLPKVILFANSSSNQADACIKAVGRMEFKSERSEEDEPELDVPVRDERVVFFDCEVYPNLFVICWKYEGADTTLVEMINPSAHAVEALFQYKLVGYNNRPYDNHVLWAASLGASNEELYQLSQKLISNDRNATFGKAWNLSYADVYDFVSEKKSLKKWEIELGIKHMEMDIPWDQPVPDEKIKQVVDYCGNDVRALEVVWNHRKGDFQARKILAELSGLTVNQSTRQHVMRILFGNEREPQKDFVYTDLSTLFPGYKFDEFHKTEKSTYHGEVVGEGGYVYAEPGIYENVALLDVASMHPTSIIKLDLFGKYTPNFKRIYDARLAVKHADEAFKEAKKFPERAAFLRDEAEQSLKEARELLPGIELNEENAKENSDALKLVLNSTYGFTAAKFENPARDKRNKDNIVAKRGALFMIDLKEFVQANGFQVVHIKTDSIKIPNATPEIIKKVMEFGAKYGYDFEHEATYKKMCLVNDAVYIAQYENGNWTATGAEFKHPYVFKTLFSGEPVTFRDLCETKQVQKGAMYLKFPEGDIHIGRSGLFVPINPHQDLFVGAELVCRRDEKDHSVNGAKGYKWAEAEMVKVLEDGAIERMTFERLEDAVEGTGSIADIVDMAYFNQLAEDAAQSIDKFGNFEEFVEDAGLLEREED